MISAPFITLRFFSKSGLNPRLSYFWSWLMPFFFPLSFNNIWLKSFIWKFPMKNFIWNFQLVGKWSHISNFIWFILIKPFCYISHLDTSKHEPILTSWLEVFTSLWSFSYQARKPLTKLIFVSQSNSQIPESSHSSRQRLFLPIKCLLEFYREGGRWWC